MVKTAWLAMAAGVLLMMAGSARALPQSGAGAGSNSNSSQKQNTEQAAQSSAASSSTTSEPAAQSASSAKSATTEAASGASGSTSSSTGASAGEPSKTATGTQTDSLVAAARKARAERKEAPKSTRTFTNDNLPTQGGISTVGDKNASSGDNGAAASADNSSGANGYPNGNDEKGWRDLFSKLRTKESQDEDALTISQRELGQLGPQFYGDPNKQMMQDLTRSDINKKTAEIDNKKRDVQADKDAISAAEEALREAGGDAGWAR
jgi:hypothetical protein